MPFIAGINVNCLNISEKIFVTNRKFWNKGLFPRRRVSHLIIFPRSMIGRERTKLWVTQVDDSFTAPPRKKVVEFLTIVLKRRGKSDLGIFADLNRIRTDWNILLRSHRCINRAWRLKLEVRVSFQGQVFGYLILQYFRVSENKDLPTFSAPEFL